MSLNVELTPQEEARFRAFARQMGADPVALARKLLTESLPMAKNSTPTAIKENAAVVAMLEGFLAESPTDPEEQRQAEVEFEEFKKNLDSNRVMSGFSR